LAELSHVGLTVKNLELSLAFYRDVAGMEQAGQVIELHSREFDTLTSNPGAALKVAHLTAGSFTLQLVEYVAAGGTTLELGHHHVGNPHLCFYVADVEAKYQELERRGDVRITSGLVRITPVTRSFYTADPDGVPVEFLQMNR
jgi:catechol 2,3-dioxygenase-like lactoylglutathione lyase family enzyme